MQEIAIFPNRRNMVKHRADLPSPSQNASREKREKVKKKCKKVEGNKKEANKKEHCL